MNIKKKYILIDGIFTKQKNIKDICHSEFWPEWSSNSFQSLGYGFFKSDCFTRIISSILGHLLASSYDQSVVFIVLLLLCLQLAFTEASSYNCIHWNICVYKWSRRWLPEIVRLYFLSLLVLIIWEWLLHIFCLYSPIQRSHPNEA